MAMPKQQFTTIDDYIATSPEDVREILQKLRQTIHAAAPDAEEAISYQMPTFKLHGNLIHFAAFKSHIGLYPTPSATEEFARELAPYAVSKGTIRFPLNQPIPYDLVTRIVQFRVQETLNKRKSKKKST
ncbi:MAG: DUF1801 domain-containing protein [Anaerolineae bacterium]|nr:DUF1801 domain-containing protein [Anaerolineae bacterium]MCA9907160.1 DUF1801 domain-containing protein [Anaerolineae bacterium]